MTEATLQYRNGKGDLIRYKVILSYESIGEVIVLMEALSEMNEEAEEQ